MTTLSPKSVIIATYALTGFANFSSIGIQIGGISAVAPSRKSALASLGLKAMFGGAIAWLLVATSIGLISGPVSRLAVLYESAFDLSSLAFTSILLLIAGSGLLGLTGSWLAVGRHLSAIEPS